MLEKECQRQQRITLSQNWKMCGLAVNIMNFAHLVKKVDFDAVVDH